MSAAFEESNKRGRRAQSERDWPGVKTSFEAALVAATAPHERSFALNGLADFYFVERQYERALELMDQAIAACLPEPDTETPKETLAAQALAEAWSDKFMLLRVTNREEEAVTVIDELSRRLLDRSDVSAPSDDTAHELQAIVVRALVSKGIALDFLDRPDEALACYNDVLRRFENSPATAIQRQIAKAIRWRASSWQDLGRQDRMIADYDELAARFGHSKDRHISETVLDGLERKVALYRDQEDLDLVIDTCDQIIGLYEADPYWRTANVVARVMIRRSVAFGKRGEHSKELAGYDSVISRYGDSSESLLRRHAAKALMFKAVSLNDADQGAAEIECYDEVIRRYRDDPDEEVREVAADALVYKGTTLGAIAIDAAEDTGVREIDAEIACYDDAIAHYGAEEFIGLRRVVAEALLHKAEALADVGRASEAATCLDRLIAGYDGTDDKELNELVKDARTLRAEI